MEILDGYIGPFQTYMMKLCPKIINSVQLLIDTVLNKSSKTSYRNSRPEVFCKKSLLRNFAKFTLKHPSQVSFFIKLQASACNFIKKRDSGTGVFL